MRRHSGEQCSTPKGMFSQSPNYKLPETSLFHLNSVSINNHTTSFNDTEYPFLNDEVDSSGHDVILNNNFDVSEDPIKHKGFNVNLNIEALNSLQGQNNDFIIPKNVFDHLYLESIRRQRRLQQKSDDILASQSQALQAGREKLAADVRRVASRVKDNSKTIFDRSNELLEKKKILSAVGAALKFAKQMNEEQECTFKPKINKINTTDQNDRTQRQTLLNLKYLFAKQGKMAMKIRNLTKDIQGVIEQRFLQRKMRVDRISLYEKEETNRILLKLKTPEGAFELKEKILNFLADNPDKCEEEAEEFIADSLRDEAKQVAMNRCKQFESNSSIPVFNIGSCPTPRPVSAKSNSKIRKNVRSPSAVRVNSQGRYNSTPATKISNYDNLRNENISSSNTPTRLFRASPSCIQYNSQTRPKPVLSSTSSEDLEQSSRHDQIAKNTTSMVTNELSSCKTDLITSVRHSRYTNYLHRLYSERESTFEDMHRLEEEAIASLRTSGFSEEFISSLYINLDVHSRDSLIKSTGISTRLANPPHSSRWDEATEIKRHDNISLPVSAPNHPDITVPNQNIHFSGNSDFQGSPSSGFYEVNKPNMSINIVQNSFSQKTMPAWPKWWHGNGFEIGFSLKVRLEENKIISCFIRALRQKEVATGLENDVIPYFSDDYLSTSPSGDNGVRLNSHFHAQSKNINNLLFDSKNKKRSTQSKDSSGKKHTQVVDFEISSPTQQLQSNNFFYFSDSQIQNTNVSKTIEDLNCTGDVNNDLPNTVDFLHINKNQEIDNPLNTVETTQTLLNENDVSDNLNYTHNTNLNSNIGGYANKSSSSPLHQPNHCSSSNTCLSSSSSTASLLNSKLEQKASDSLKYANSVFRIGDKKKTCHASDFLNGNSFVSHVEIPSSNVAKQKNETEYLPSNTSFISRDIQSSSSGFIKDRNTRNSDVSAIKLFTVPSRPVENRFNERTVPTKIEKSQVNLIQKQNETIPTKTDFHPPNNSASFETAFQVQSFKDHTDKVNDDVSVGQTIPKKESSDALSQNFRNNVQLSSSKLSNFTTDNYKNAKYFPTVGNLNSSILDAELDEDDNYNTSITMSSWTNSKILKSCELSASKQFLPIFHNIQSNSDSLPIKVSDGCDTQFQATPKKMGSSHASDVNLDVRRNSARSMNDLNVRDAHSQLNIDLNTQQSHTDFFTQKDVKVSPLNTDNASHSMCEVISENFEKQSYTSHDNVNCDNSTDTIQSKARKLSNYTDNDIKKNINQNGINRIDTKPTPPPSIVENSDYQLQDDQEDFFNK